MSNQKNRPESEFKQIMNSQLIKNKYVAIGLGAAALLWVGGSTWYTVGTDEIGVVTRFGRETGQNEAGLHFKLPWPIEKVQTPKVTKINTIEIGFRTAKEDAKGKATYLEPENNKEMENEAKMLTGDLNIIYSAIVIQYKIGDASAYLWNVAEQEKIVRKIGEAAQRQVVGNRSLDGVLTIGKSDMEKEIRQKTQELSDLYGLGFYISQVQLQNPRPTKQVKPSFDAVVDAKEKRVELINQAQTYRNEIIPAANGQAVEMVQKAEGYSAKRIEEAKGDVLAFAQVLQEYQKAKDVTRTRMYLETMQKIMPTVDKIIIGTPEGGLLKLLDVGRSGGEQK